MLVVNGFGRGESTRSGGSAVESIGGDGLGLLDCAVCCVLGLGLDWLDFDLSPRRCCSRNNGLLFGHL
jgi:hypothetical protein